MSAAPTGSNAATTKATVSDSTSTPAVSSKPSTALEEDDEFEDFPVEDWDTPSDLASQSAPDASTSGNQPSSTAQQGSGGPSAHLWEESWDDDDATTAGEDFAAQLRGELGKK
ncbi:hypothetical protein K461DRAFT_267711 [Myriangium duriaei CBS 260.36]|uniref:26S proteasome complex subunit SEM1 n=1 Tax=Myriangium duriaei CBS 260.36 TaxID=1168546 RepID=A0A9P4J614_9PEZI|nr:hypothetical protein K461DRAFT_267711 [Myriangium duriaei CBS 260.36]